MAPRVPGADFPVGLLQGWRPLLYGVLLDLHFCVPNTAVLRLRPSVAQDVVGGLMWVGGEFLGLWIKCVHSQIVKAVRPKDAHLDLMRGLIFVVLPFGLRGACGHGSLRGMGRRGLPLPLQGKLCPHLYCWGLSPFLGVGRVLLVVALVAPSHPFLIKPLPDGGSRDLHLLGQGLVLLWVEVSPDTREESYAPSRQIFSAGVGKRRGLFALMATFIWNRVAAALVALRTTINVALPHMNGLGSSCLI